MFNLGEKITMALADKRSKQPKYPTNFTFYGIKDVYDKTFWLVLVNINLTPPR